MIRVRSRELASNKPHDDRRKDDSLQKGRQSDSEEGDDGHCLCIRPSVEDLGREPLHLDAFGKDWFDVKEGEASIFKPAGGGKYAPIARVQIDQWAAAKK